MDPAPKQQRYGGKKSNTTAKQPKPNPGATVKTQEAVAAVGFTRAHPKSQDTSPLPLPAAEQHKQQPQAKPFGHEALFGR